MNLRTSLTNRPVSVLASPLDDAYGTVGDTRKYALLMITDPTGKIPTLTDDVRKIFSAEVPKKSIEVVTVHMMGTARMGSDRSRAVTDGFGMVHDADGLMVCDASLFPTPIGVNPMETIQALATRAAANILDNPGRFK